ncbi:MAG: TonB-dependent receptor [Xanthomonadales bacterium]|nr:TonB-dependent receptor [Xanthomonadales bacterium]
MKTITSFLAGFFLLSVSVSLLAQTEGDDEQDDEAQSIEEVIVLASRTNATVASMPNQVTIVNEEEIQRAITVSDSMSGVLENTVPGFSGSSTSQTMRGISLRGGNPLILVDGIPQYVSMFDSNKEANPIDMDFVSKVEVIHGASAVQGIGGTGGVINLVTKMPSDDEGFSQDVTLRLNSDTSFSDDGLHKKLAYTAGWSNGDLSFMAGYSRNYRGMSYDGNGDLVGLVRFSGSIGDTVADNLMLKMNYSSGQHSFSIMFNDYHMEARENWAPVAGCHPNRCEPAQLQSAEQGWDNSIHALPPEDDNTSLVFDYFNDDLFGWTLSAQVFESDFDYRFGGTTSAFYDNVNPPSAIVGQTAVTSDKNGFRLALSKTIAEVVDVTFGYDSYNEETFQWVPQNNMVIIPPTELEQSAPFVYATWSVTDQFRLNAGVRRVDSEVSIGDFIPIPFYLVRGSGPVTGGSTDSTDSIVNYGAMFDITDDISIHASVTEGFELAEVGRVVRNNGVAEGVTLSNDYLAISPNIHENVEFGIRYDDGVTMAELAIFEQKAPFGSSYAPNSEGILEISRESTRRTGYTASFSRQFTDTLGAGISFAHVDAESDTDGDGSYDTDLVSLSAGAPDQIKLYIDFALYGWDGKATWIKYDDKTYTNTIYSFDGYDLASVDLTRTFGNGGTVGIAIANLFDEQYIDLYSQISRNNNWYVAGVGRTLGVSYNQRF